MTNFQKLKHDARRAEQRSDWKRAIDLYRRALDSDAETVDLSIYNRIGDLHMRQGETEAAVECYEQAADRYAAQGMHTSAIALCNKVLRIAPDRDAVYERLGRLHAQTGLMAEGRRHCILFVERALEQGRRDDATDAVKRFAELTGDEQIKSLYADTLKSRGHGPVEELESPPEGSPAGVPDSVGSQAGSTDLGVLVGQQLQSDGLNLSFDPAATTMSKPAFGSTASPFEGTRRLVANFRSRISGMLSEDDSTVRYDLGVEFMTIGLLEEAIEEFSIALREPVLVEAANARIAECVVMRGAEPTVPLAARPAEPEPRPEAQSEPQSEAQSESLPEPESEQHLPETTTEDDSESHFFRARLAQYRIRRAEERHTVDYAAHVELGAAYVEMELVQEAVREFVVALKGPRPVAARAARAMKRLGEHDDTPSELALYIVESLSTADEAETATELIDVLGGRWGASHAHAVRLQELRTQIALIANALPDIESLFPGIGVQEAEPATETSRELSELEELLSEIDGDTPADDMADALRADDEHLQVLRQADDYQQQGRLDEAADLLIQTLARLQDERRAREALTVLDRLLALRPDDIVLHHQKTELALMVNDRRELLVAYSQLGACLRRQGAARSARTTYGRILDFDPGNEAARAAIAEIDRAEIATERKAVARKSPDPRVAGPDMTDDLDAVLSELEGDDQRDDADPPVDPASLATAHKELGLAFRQMGMWDEAAEELLAAFPLLADDAEVLEAVGESLRMCGRYDEAIAQLEPRVDLVDTDAAVGVRYQLAQALLASGRDADAREALALVEEARPGYRDAARLLSELSH